MSLSAEFIEEEYNTCCFCNNKCSYSSQSCSRCARLLTSGALGWNNFADMRENINKDINILNNGHKDNKDDDNDDIKMKIIHDVNSRMLPQYENIQCYIHIIQNMGEKFGVNFYNLFEQNFKKNGFNSFDEFNKYTNNIKNVITDIQKNAKKIANDNNVISEEPYYDDDPNSP
jgi:hypothetical protein